MKIFLPSLLVLSPSFSPPNLHIVFSISIGRGSQLFISPPIVDIIHDSPSPRHSLHFRMANHIDSNPQHSISTPVVNPQPWLSISTDHRPPTVDLQPPQLSISVQFSPFWSSFACLLIWSISYFVFLILNSLQEIYDSMAKF